MTEQQKKEVSRAFMLLHEAADVERSHCVAAGNNEEADWHAEDETRYRLAANALYVEFIPEMEESHWWARPERKP